MEFHQYFPNIDWMVLGGYLLLTTWVGHLLKGKQSTIKDFFLGGRSLPWQAVAGSIIATEISGVTFIGVPGMVYAAGGDFTYLQWGIGSIIARIIVGIYFVRVFYEREIFSPYDYMGNQLGEGAKRLATIIFQVGGILGQSVRVLVAALALKVVTPLEFHHCIWIIGLFAVGWTLMGGMRTVIWTDVMQFFLFVGAGLFSLFWILSQIDGGWSQMTEVAGEAGKFTLFNLTTDPAVGFTLWVAIIAAPFQNLSAFGVDQLNAQRMFCCRDANDARKAMIASSGALLLTLLMLFVGTALFAYYEPMRMAGTEPAIFNEDTNAVFPVWIVTELPVGLRGLILAGIFAAAISSLDSILAALSQTTLGLLKPKTDKDAEKRRLFLSRILVLVWGILLSAFAVELDSLRGKVNVVVLAFGMISYTTGPMLGMFLASLLSPKAGVKGLSIGFALSFLMVASLRPDFYQILLNYKVITFDQALQWSFLQDRNGELAPTINTVWAWPVTVFITWGFGVLIPQKKKFP
ncbi:MAG: sodium/solute symporter [Opitutae bacterium]|nr:sodium/solute symporter [Opitutae bacterium]